MPKSKEARPPEPEAEKPSIVIGPWENEGHIIIPEKTAEEAAQAKQAKKARIENAKKKLQEMLKEGKNPSLNAETEKLYGEITGENLVAHARESAYREIQEENKKGKKIRFFTAKEQYLTEEKISLAQGWAVRDEMEQYGKTLSREKQDEIKEEYGDMGIYIKEKAKSLSAMAGVKLSGEAVFAMMRGQGIDPENIKTTGWWVWKKIKITSADGSSVKLSKEAFENQTREAEQKFMGDMRRKGVDELEKIVAKGRGKATERRETHASKILQKAAEEEKPEVILESPDLAVLKKLKQALKERFEGGVSFESTINAKTKELESFSQKSKKIEPLSDTEIKGLKELGLLEKNVTGTISTRKIAGIGETLIKKIEDIAKKAKMGRSLSLEEAKVFRVLKEFIGE